MPARLKILFIILIFSSHAFAGQEYPLEKIVVKTEGTSTAESSLRKNYSSETISSEEIKEKNLNSPADLLDYVAGMDLRYRGTFGIQGDLSLRGSTYEQVAVLIDGISLMDPQTGHHNLDIPLTAFDVERVEVIKEPVSSLYGAGSFAGSVNIVTKKPSKKILNLDTLFGEHALSGQAISFSLPGEGLSSRVSFDHKVSKGARCNTDFEYSTTSLYLNKDLDESSLSALLGFQKKDFGADSFYSNLFPEEEEHTETFFIRTGLDSNLSFGSLKDNLYFRRHRDKFILNRNNPASVNYHTTYIYGLGSQLSLPVKYGDILLGMDTGMDQINSTNLGKHSRQHEAASFGFIPILADRLSADLRFRVDYYEKWQAQESFNAGAGYELIKDRLKMKGSFAGAFRVPTFTELYYSDPANKGNPELKIEKSDSFKLGLDYGEGIFDSGLEGFLRRGKNLIDWTRASITERWQATNLGRVDLYGVEFRAALRPKLEFLKKIDFSYTYMKADKKAGGFISKYALDILNHQLMLGVYSNFFGLDFNCYLSYNQRYYGEVYFVGNLYLAKKIIGRDFTLEPFLKIDNFTDTEYSEIQGVPEPGRWIKAGMKFEW